MNMKTNDYADENQKSLYKKFPSTHYLSNPNNVNNVLLWNTFFRRNLHRLSHLLSHYMLAVVVLHDRIQKLYLVLLQRVNRSL